MKKARFSRKIRIITTTILIRLVEFMKNTAKQGNQREQSGSSVTKGNKKCHPVNGDEGGKEIGQWDVEINTGEWPVGCSRGGVAPANGHWATIKGMCCLLKSLSEKSEKIKKA